MSQPVATTAGTTPAAAPTTTATTHPTYEEQAKGKTSRITTNLQNQAQHLKEKLAGPNRAAAAGTGTTTGAEHDPTVNQNTHGFMAKAKQGIADGLTYTQQGLESAKDKFNGTKGQTTTGQTVTGAPTGVTDPATTAVGHHTTGAPGTATTGNTAGTATTGHATTTTTASQSTTTTASGAGTGTAATGGRTGFPAPTEL